jgi:hypothetical protein
LKSSKKVDFGQFLSSKKIRKPDRESLKWKLLRFANSDHFSEWAYNY